MNTIIDLDLLTEAQEPQVKSFFGAGHYNTIKKCLPELKEFYEHKDWKLLANLGFLQIYTKPADDETSMHILARCEINHKVSDIGNEIYKQNVFISEDPSVLETEVIQNVGEDADVFHVKFKKFLMAEQPDAVVLVQKIQHRDSSKDSSIVIPVVSINHYKKKPVEGWERLEVKVGGWVLKPLGATKTLVNVFLNAKFPKTRVPEVVLSKHAKSLVSMLRTLESLCNKTYFNYRFGSKIFEKTQTIILDENNQSRMAYIPPELDEEEEEKLVDEEEEKVANGKPYVLESSNKPKTYSIKVPYPTDVEDINPDDVEDEHREYILGTRKRLTQLIDLTNN